MQEKPALRPSVAVGEALRGVARDILAEARAAIENPTTKSDADAVHDFRRACLGEGVARHAAQRFPHRHARPQGGFLLHRKNIGHYRA